jgi:hypothetical protein
MGAEAEAMLGNWPLALAVVGIPLRLPASGSAFSSLHFPGQGYLRERVCRHIADCRKRGRLLSSASILTIP